MSINQQLIVSFLHYNYIIFDIKDNFIIAD